MRRCVNESRKEGNLDLEGGEENPSTYLNGIIVEIFIIRLLSTVYVIRAR